MKKLFIQFYLLLFVCFLVMSLLVGLVYKFTAERAGKQSLDDLMNSSLYLMRSELREIPPHAWGKTLKEMDLNLSLICESSRWVNIILTISPCSGCTKARLSPWMISTHFYSAYRGVTMYWPWGPSPISITFIKCVYWMSD